MYAPSAGNEQAWQFIVVTGDPLKKFLEKNQNVPSSTPCGILVCNDKRLEKYPGINSSIFDCSAAIQNMLLASHSKGYGALWCYVFDANRPAIKELFNIPKDVEPFSFMPIGKSKESIKEIPQRFDESKIHYNSFNEKFPQ